MVIHECRTLADTDVEIAINKINGAWFWVFRDSEGKNNAHGIAYCPYCGEKLK